MSPSSLRGSISLIAGLLYCISPSHPIMHIMSPSSLRGSISLTTGLIYYNYPLVAP